MRKIVATLLVSLDGVVEAPQRWHLAYMDAELAASVGLQLAAADAGYADQAHLTREAKELEGRSPRTLLLESEQRCGCGHDHAASYRPLLAGAGSQAPLR